MGERPTDPGWYPDPQGGSNYQIYWNGDMWTEVRPTAQRARRLANTAGIVLAVILLVTLMGAGLAGGGEGQGNWIAQALFVLFGGLAAVPAAIAFFLLSNRARRIEEEHASD